jgi:glyoxylase I family protein
MMIFSHVAISCRDVATSEDFYGRHFGFRRSRAFQDGKGGEIVFIKQGATYLELFPAEAPRPTDAPTNDGPHSVGFRHVAFQVDDVDGKLAAMGEEARITLGPLSFDEAIPGWRTVWISDPDGNILEISQGYRDPENSPQT